MRQQHDVNREEVVRILFWNMKRRDLRVHVRELARSTGASIVVVCESGTSEQELLAELQGVDSDFYAPKQMSDRFMCFCREPRLDFSEVSDNARWSFRWLRVSAGRVLVGLVHGRDPMNNYYPLRQSGAEELAGVMRMLMDLHQCRRVVLLGDFNMNPFDSAMNLPRAFNAMMTKECTRRGTRTYGGEEYDFFYNPMWGFFGDRAPGPPGTIYYQGNAGLYGWNMFDQVILHHSMIPELVEVDILDRAGNLPLVNGSGRPLARQVSDHLPIRACSHYVW